MRNVLKLKNIKSDIIEASISSHAGDNFSSLCKNNLMNKYKNKELTSMQFTYKRTKFLDKAKDIMVDLMLYYLEKSEEKILHEKINRHLESF